MQQSLQETRHKLLRDTFLESHRMCLHPSAMMCDNMCKVLSTREAHLSLVVQNIGGQWHVHNAYMTNLSH